jgi:tetratricopeptide (TPR) repeat protein
MLMVGAAQSQVPDTLFDQANKFYEEGEFQKAAGMYQHLIDQGSATSTVFFNLGNAWFKAGANGRAIAAYRQAERLTPRDPSLRFNLHFVREQVKGKESSSGAWGRQWLLNLTTREWSTLFGFGLWTWFALLALREYRPAWRPALRGYTATAGFSALVLGLCLYMNFHFLHNTINAVVVVPNAVVRLGPLEESKVHYQLRDGEEITVLDEKAVTQRWLQVRDSEGRVGWVKEDEVIILSPRLVQSSKTTPQVTPTDPSLIIQHHETSPSHPTFFHAG